MTAGISLISGKTGAHRAPLQLLDPSFPQPANQFSVGSFWHTSPVGAKDSFAPPGLRSFRNKTPGLRPGLHSVAAPRLNTRPEQMRYCASEIAPAIHEFIGATDSPMLNEG